MNKRIGASRRDQVNPDILRQLNCGQIESATLVECLAMDFTQLFLSLDKGLTLEQLVPLERVREKGVVERMKVAAELAIQLWQHNAFDKLAKHPSDTVRGWAAFVLGLNGSMVLGEKLIRVYPLADDPHFGVREWAWLGLRRDLAEDIGQSIELLQSWVVDKSPFIRRFAIEGTRPRGVWSKHITELKQQPELAVNLLDKVMLDSDRYVQDSVANWLNDAVKSQPNWVKGYIGQWQSKAQSDGLDYIAKRGVRSAK